MKILGNMMLILILAIVFSACQKTVDPVSPDPSNKIEFVTNGLAETAYSGTFEVTFKNYKNTDRTVSISGTIDIVFGKSTYTYEAKISNASEDVTDTYLHDTGTYTLEAGRITMADDATKLMNAGTMPSLYLSGDYTYTHTAAQSTIEGTGAYGTVKIIFKAQ